MWWCGSEGGRRRVGALSSLARASFVTFDGVPNPENAIKPHALNEIHDGGRFAATRLGTCNPRPKGQFGQVLGSIEALTRMCVWVAQWHTC